MDVLYQQLDLEHPALRELIPNVEGIVAALKDGRFTPYAVSVDYRELDFTPPVLQFGGTPTARYFHGRTRARLTFECILEPNPPPNPPPEPPSRAIPYAKQRKTRYAWRNREEVAEAMEGFVVECDDLLDLGDHEVDDERDWRYMDI